MPHITSPWRPSLAWRVAVSTWFLAAAAGCGDRAASAGDLQPVGDGEAVAACTACTTDEDCGGSLCLLQDRTWGCAPSCRLDQDCDTGFRCTTGPDGVALVCQPATGACDCHAGLAAGARTCRVDGQPCVGEQSCDPEVGWGACETPSPAPELCDLRDNDCDGAVDEDFTDADGGYSSFDDCGGCGDTCAGPGIPGGEPACLEVPGAGWGCGWQCGDGSVTTARGGCPATREELACAACDDDQECGDGECEAAAGPGDESFCILPCDLSGVGEACPEGFICVATGGGAALCRPPSRDCTCTVTGAARGCEVTNASGRCRGVETCDPQTGWSDCDAPTPAEEACNNVDDDCDGLTDEGCDP